MAVLPTPAPTRLRLPALVYRQDGPRARSFAKRAAARAERRVLQAAVRAELPAQDGTYTYGNGRLVIHRTTTACRVA